MRMTCDEHSLIADVAVVADGKVLLVKCADTNRYDHQAGWFLPDDSVRHLEHPERAAVRIAKEQLGLDVRGVRMSHIESFKGNDGSWHMPFHFVADFDRAQTIAPSSEIAAAHWFGLDDSRRDPKWRTRSGPCRLFRQSARRSERRRPSRRGADERARHVIMPNWA